MIIDKINYIIEDLLHNHKEDKNLVLHIYLGFLENSVVAGNLFLHRYKIRLEEYKIYGTACLTST